MRNGVMNFRLRGLFILCSSITVTSIVLTVNCFIYCCCNAGIARPLCQRESRVPTVLQLRHRRNQTAWGANFASVPQACVASARTTGSCRTRTHAISAQYPPLSAVCLSWVVPSIYQSHLLHESSRLRLTDGTVSIFRFLGFSQVASLAKRNSAAASLLWVVTASRSSDALEGSLLFAGNSKVRLQMRAKMSLVGMARRNALETFAAVHKVRLHCLLVSCR